MREKLHRILDLVLELNEQGATHATVDYNGHVDMIWVHVWEGGCKRENTLMHDYTYYAGELCNEKKIDDFIRQLEELRDEI